MNNKIPDTLSEDIKQTIDFLNVDPIKFIQDIGLAKAERPQSLGVASKPFVTRGYQEPIFETYTARGIRENYRPLSFNVLREIERKNPVVSTITNTRTKQVRAFAQQSTDKNEPGFRIALREAKRKPTRIELEEIEYLSNWFKFTGRTNFENWEEREDNLRDILVKMVRDYLTIDQIAIELRRDRKGTVVDFHALDSATIFRTVQGGYRGSRSDFDPRSYLMLDQNAEKELVKQKLLLIPEQMSKIAFVQKIEGRLVAAFTRQDMIFDSLQKRTDIRYHGLGYPPLEQAMNACTAFLFAIAYNAEVFNSGTIPKIALAFKEGNFSEEQLLDLQDQWIANFRGIQGSWRIPMFNTDVNVLDLYKSPRDMEYMKYMEFMGSLIFAVMGMDAQEAGLRWQQAQNVLNENQGARLHFSKNRGLNDLLGGMAEVFDKILMLMGLGRKYKFEFTGIEPEDQEKRSKLSTEAVKRDKTVNQLRAENDDPPDPYGDIILDPQYIQYRLQKEAMESEGEGQAENIAEDEETDTDIVDATVDNLFKAEISDSSKIRTLLL